MEIEDLSHLITELKEIYPYIQFLRRNNGEIEFSLPRSDGIVEFFPYYRLPVAVEKRINLLLRLGA